MSKNDVDGAAREALREPHVSIHVLSAEDTVMGEADFQKLIKEHPDVMGLGAVLLTVLNRQAEISFARGKDVGFEIGLEQGTAEGRREVVDTIKFNCADCTYKKVALGRMED